METLAETSLPSGLRRTEPSSLIPTSPEGEQSPQNSGSMLANIIGTSPGGSSGPHHHHHLLEDHSQSSQEDGSGSVLSPGPHAEPEETIENIEKELSESCADTDSQPALEAGHGKRSGGQGAASTSAAVAVAAAAGGKEQSTGQTPSVSNGASLPRVAPSGGKPKAMRDFDRKMNKSRGRPKRKAMVAMYQSQISENKIGIKLCIKKASDATVQPKKPIRKRARKPRSLNEDSSDETSPEKRNRRTEKPRPKKTNNNTEKRSAEEAYTPPKDQSVWANGLPESVLYTIFKNAVQEEGCLPTLIRLSEVCTAWYKVSQQCSLWRTVDLGTWGRDRFKTEPRLKWLIENRLQHATEVGLANWKVTNVQCVLDKLLEAAPGLTTISLAGWKALSTDHLMFLVQNFKSLRNLDLSSVNAEVNANKTAVGQTSLCNAIKEMGSRLTHLHLAHNRLSGIPQIVKALATHCPNLLLLDLSNVNTVAMSHGILHIEQLQHGCQKLKVLRITNSHINLSTASLQEQMESPGFPELEELSVASLADEARLFNDEFLQRILKTSTKLTLLDVRGCARLTHDSLIRLPTWDLKHLFLSGCSINRDMGAGLELIASKWAHSLIEFDLAWASATKPLDDALKALADKGSESPLKYLNLCGSSVSLEAVKEVLANCPHINAINLASCRGLPRGVKRLLQGAQEIAELRENLGVTLKCTPGAQSALAPSSPTDT
ncbi:F-box/LRR-repeat protein 6 [Anopheles gambiae]|uniref:F-box domain-containing protein n=1 Tax=Anopheles coluzzii TaxID=1518534 RepID=A0A6E8VQ41_ANOCL|nr:F-box/LRR-repeat protein 6 [Anopheles coluzzii]XP_040241205.2 F-box/LRR-repeat protein 6 [Anopheles coluzzii]XP_040241206.2 F-box/LRR-repeat protein 6 [Anopheles coluzzii]XP_040241207.2 F-box/LRR-repeat protein 6 [Anopheles coluzzii]XP_040241208.2 F-box/LRR-repeat protein 6 [Anopheles coluzzii]XP_040241210.2 F-box/LRR-repeat protein 6 [Anopheles coluzzii]XP_049463002.1 F-box/LRR-repeat protein 6 [Anopheles coluzzii]XP_061508805.1 F-box/LRR-repeat protein 6 [Anopheles gambiae]XP_061508806